MKTLVCSERVPSGLKIYENMKQMRKLQEALCVPNEYQFYLSGDSVDVWSAAELGIVRDE